MLPNLLLIISHFYQLAAKFLAAWKSLTAQASNPECIYPFRGKFYRINLIKEQ